MIILKNRLTDLNLINLIKNSPIFKPIVLKIANPNSFYHYDYGLIEVIQHETRYGLKNQPFLYFWKKLKIYEDNYIFFQLKNDPSKIVCQNETVFKKKTSLIKIHNNTLNKTIGA